MTDNKVLVTECKDYNVELIKEKIAASLEPLGGIDNFVSPGQKVLLKPNLLMAKEPQAAITTHPVVVQAVAELVIDSGGEVTIGDSPGGPFTKSAMKRLYRKTGMERVAENTAAKLNWNLDSTTIPFATAKILKSLTLGQFIEGADVIINLPKFKTHGLTKMTGGVKNMFGSVPGLLKAEYHLNMPQITDFSDALLDIALATKPSLTIVDGIVAMEGEGPSSGDKREFNRLLVATNPLALDVVMAHLVGIEPEAVATIKAAQERELTHSLEQVELLGVDTKLSDFVTPTIDSSARLLDSRMPGFMADLIRKLVKPKPVFKDDKCIQCGICIASCPPQIISKTKQGVEADLDDCIRCFCCQELCPQEAVEIDRPLLGKLLFGK
jgi:uncharacterized protein (DUF362 family)/Pyruvate/2-oxoacid:ferredoxin oxidoreductase delta subunit